MKILTSVLMIGLLVLLETTAIAHDKLAYEFHVSLDSDGSNTNSIVVNFTYHPADLIRSFRVRNNPTTEVRIKIFGEEALSMERLLQHEVIDASDYLLENDKYFFTIPVRAATTGKFIAGVRLEFYVEELLVGSITKDIFLEKDEQGNLSLISLSEYNKMFRKTQRRATSEELNRNLEEGDVPGEGQRGPHEPDGPRCGEGCISR